MPKEPKPNRCEIRHGVCTDESDCAYRVNNINCRCKYLSNHGLCTYQQAIVNAITTKLTDKENKR